MNSRRNDSSKGEISVREAGRRGGQATSQTHNRDFYQEIGHKGGTIGGPKGGQRVRELVEKGKREMGE